MHFIQNSEWIINVGIIFFIVSVLIIIIHIVSRQLDPTHSKGNFYKIFIIVIVLVSATTAAIVILDIRNMPSDKAIELSDRIDIVTDKLQNASAELNLIQVELQERIELVETLQEQAGDAEALIEISSIQREALARLLGAEMDSRNERNLLTNAFMSFFSLVIGIVLTHFYQKWWDKKSKKG